ncbi:unnamed protein product [Bursaphelenchus xylophilus]|nr:unnamed protein product [Bursaphelenchus xylophilus]CAG9107328.1 unnamed protein product [Bursaphelenchus xylophilus]
MRNLLFWVFVLLGVGVKATVLESARMFNERLSNDPDSFLLPGRVILPKNGNIANSESQIKDSYFEAMKSLADKEGIKLITGQNPSLLDINEGLRNTPFNYPAKIYRPHYAPRFQSAAKLCEKLRMC